LRRLSVEVLLGAYAIGMFPMANAYDDPTVHWIEPRRRGVIPLDGFHVPRSLRKALRRERLELRVDTGFEAVVRACAEPRPDRPETWLNEELIDAYVALHRAGHAHSVETWAQGRLVGGLYGVKLGGAFFGESMFSRERDASKMALVELVGRLRAGRFSLLDTQFLTRHLVRFGGIEISRAQYLTTLRRALLQPAVFPLAPYPFWPEVLGGAEMGASVSGGSGSPQSTTQTS
jgi:leucyl/phenylalanyl-tRNA--protein transferase